MLFKVILKLLGYIPQSFIRGIFVDYFYGEVVSERIIEYALAVAFLDYKGVKENRKVLDVGCFYSNFPIQLASMGFRVWGIDPENYILSHPNFKFMKGDIKKTEFSNNFFDVVTSVSTIEHIGLGYYLDSEDAQGDKIAIKEIHRITKKNGLLVITIPFNKKFRIGKSQRFYDSESLKNLITPEFTILRKEFFKSQNNKWSPIKESEVPTTRTEKTDCIALVLAKKNR